MTSERALLRLPRQKKRETLQKNRGFMSRFLICLLVPSGLAVLKKTWFSVWVHGVLFYLFSAED